jgi:hypothetical protein
VKELTETIEEFNKDYVNCTNWQCRAAIAKKNIKYHKQWRSGIICD